MDWKGVTTWLGPAAVAAELELITRRKLRFKTFAAKEAAQVALKGEHVSVGRGALCSMGVDGRFQGHCVLGVLAEAQGLLDALTGDFSFGMSQSGDIYKAGGKLGLDYPSIRDLVKLNDWTENDDVRLARVRAAVDNAEVGPPREDFGTILMGPGEEKS